MKNKKRYLVPGSQPGRAARSHQDWMRHHRDPRRTSSIRHNTDYSRPWRGRRRERRYGRVRRIHGGRGGSSRRSDAWRWAPGGWILRRRREEARRMRRDGGGEGRTGGNRRGRRGWANQERGHPSPGLPSGEGLWDAWQRSELKTDMRFYSRRVMGEQVIARRRSWGGRPSSGVDRGGCRRAFRFDGDN